MRVGYSSASEAALAEPLRPHARCRSTRFDLEDAVQASRPPQAGDIDQADHDAHRHREGASYPCSDHQRPDPDSNEDCSEDPEPAVSEASIVAEWLLEERHRRTENPKVAASRAA